MSIVGDRKRLWMFFAGFALVALILAGVASYLADDSPDGLDSAVLKGCEVVQTDAGEELTGSCIAKNSPEHALGAGPLSDYTVGGDDRFVGVAGVIGVLATLGVAFALFSLLGRRSRARDTRSTGT